MCSSLRQCQYDPGGESGYLIGHLMESESLLSHERRISSHHLAKSSPGILISTTR